MAPSASSERGREVRQLLLRAAAELIAERGWPAVSTRVLATRAGVGPGLVHYHFASLQALLTEAALGVMRGLADELTALLDQVSTPEEGLELIVGGLGGYDPEDPTSRLFSETYLAATRDAELRRAIGELIVDVRRPLARRLAEHEVPDPEATAAVLAATLDGIMLHRALSPGLTAEDVTRVLRRVLLASGPCDSRTPNGRETA